MTALSRLVRSMMTRPVAKPPVSGSARPRLAVEGLEPRDVPATFTITQGGTYDGYTFSSEDVNAPAVLINTTDPVVITNSTITGKTQEVNYGKGLIQWGVFGVNLTVTNSTFAGQRPGGYKQQEAFAVDLLNPAKLDFEHNTVNGTAGVRLLGYSDANYTHVPAQSITYKYNKVSNIDGRADDGAGGFIPWRSRTNLATSVTEDGYFGGTAIQLNKMANQPNVEIAWNQIVNDPFQGAQEDIFSILASGGASASHLNIHDNYVQGDFNARPDLASYSDGTYYYYYESSGTAIQPGDTQQGIDVGYVDVVNNWAIGASDLNLGILGGHDINVYYNVSVRSGYIPDGTGRRDASGSYFPGAIVAWDYYNSGASGRFYNNSIHDNSAAGQVVNADGSTYRLDYAYGRPGSTLSFASTDPNNPVIAGVSAYSNSVLNPGQPVTLADEAYQRTRWDNWLTQNGVTVGPSLPAGWTDTNVGNPGKAGTAAKSGGTWTVTGGGADIWGTSDQFNLAARSYSGDGSIVARVARVASLTNTNAWAKAGVMFRAGTAANAAEAAVVVTPGNGVSFQWRTTAGGSTSYTNVGGLTAPRWVKLTRAGNTFAAYYSSNGTSWTKVGATQTVSLPAAATVGLAVTAHDNAQLATATFTDVAIQQSVFTTQTPANPNTTDNRTYELGTVFRSSVAGQVTGVRFYRAASETGTNVGRLWDASGNLLATVTFTQTGSGWVTATFSQPVTIQANANYTVSVSINKSFAASSGGLSNPVTNGFLTTVGAGVFGNIGTRPTSTYNNSNYFVDPIFAGL